MDEELDVMGDCARCGHPYRNHLYFGTTKLRKYRPPTDKSHGEDACAYSAGATDAGCNCEGWKPKKGRIRRALLSSAQEVCPKCGSIKRGVRREVTECVDEHGMQDIFPCNHKWHGGACGD